VIPRAAGMAEASVCITLRRNDARCIKCVARMRHLAVSIAIAKWHRRGKKNKKRKKGEDLVDFSSPRNTSFFGWSSTFFYRPNALSRVSTRRGGSRMQHRKQSRLTRGGLVVASLRSITNILQFQRFFSNIITEA